MGSASGNRLVSRAAAAAFIVQLVACPGTAQAGFFDELFGLFLRPPSYGGYEPTFRRRHWGHGRGHGSAARKRIIAAERASPPALPEAPVDIMDDGTLRKGDAVVMADGIRIFVGVRGARHEPDDFRRPSDVKGLSKDQRKALAALEVQLPAKSGDQDLSSGRSATDARPSEAEFITDARGRTIRYVGP